MSATLSGRVVGDGGAGVAGLRVVIRDETACFPSDLGTVTTDGGGNYSATVPDDPLAEDNLGSVRKVGVSIYAAKGPRRLSYATYDVTAATVDAGTLTLRAADVSGWAVSLPGTSNALPVRKGNALRLLVDDKLAWEHVASAMSAAQKAISVMQLELDLRAYNATQSQERPEIILAFPDTYDTLHPTPLDGTTPNRVERLLLDAASGGKQVRIMISDRETNALVVIVDVAILLVPVLLTWFLWKPIWVGLGALWHSLFGGDPKGDAGTVTKYYSAAASSAKVVGFKTRMFSVVHAKAVLIDAVADAVDNAEAILLGSPFSPSYWDTLNHPVYEPRRGDCAGEPIPVHDVSLGIRGPAVADLQQQFLVHWNRDAAVADQVVALDPAPAAVTAGSGEYAATVQVVRTVNESTLPGLDAGEEGVLEAYLRAIENATKYIYIENQYFTNDSVAEALVAALKDPTRPDLQVILMVNVVPDMPFYPTWQTNLFERIRRDAGPNAARFGVFTAWTHDTAEPTHKHQNAIIMPNYLHTKTAVVDGLWAATGSANLDGASLDQFQILRPLQFGNFRNDEIDCLIFNGVDGADATDAVDQLRLELWSEHLGIPDNDPRLSEQTLEASKGWLKLWTDQANANLQALINDPATVDSSNGRILAYPTSATSGFGLLLAWSKPHKNFLQTSKIGGKAPDLSKLDLVEETTAFNYTTGKWADQ